ncbi:MAG: response regulator, partial [Desulfatiglandales bacterium]
MDGFTLAKLIRKNPQYDKVMMIMLSSISQRGEAATCEELGLNAYLSKPVRQSDLLDTIATVFGEPTGESQSALVTRHSIRENRRNLHILVAEDNEINQKLAVRALEKRGHTVEMANNGEEVLLALGDDHSFDLILMDIQMPEMDGLEAAAAIRLKEKKTGEHIPIIAMTANAMKGDKEQCLSMGMDGYVSKPIKAEELYEIIEGPLTVSQGKKKKTEKEPAGGNQDNDVLNYDEALENLDGDTGLFREIAELFLEDHHEKLTNIYMAIANEDCKALEYVALSLKDTVGAFAAKRAFQAALKLEMMAREADLTDAEETYRILKHEIKRLKPALVALVKANVKGIQGADFINKTL